MLQSSKRGSDVLVIHPGSRFLRLGRASDHTSVTIPHVIARKFKTQIPSRSPVYAVPPFREAPARFVVVPPPPGMPDVTSDYEVEADPDDPVSTNRLT